MSFGRSPGRVAGLPREAFRPSPIFLGILALFIVSGWMTWTGFGNVQIDVFLFVVTGWTVSLCLHEYAHALVAYKGGDHDVAHRGYLTLDPVKYTHPLLSFVLPVVFLMMGGIGLPGGAVWVNHSVIRSRAVDSLISFAGPATNLVFAVALVLPFTFGLDGGDSAFWAALAFLAFLQLTASILNFLPVPGIDGGNLLFPWLSPQWQRGFNHVAPYGMLLLIALLFFSPVVNNWFFNVVYALGDVIGLPSSLISDGYSLFKFWS
jgi:Zn-dependent protease